MGDEVVHLPLRQYRVSICEHAVLLATDLNDATSSPSLSTRYFASISKLEDRHKEHILRALICMVEDLQNGQSMFLVYRTGSVHRRLSDARTDSADL